MGLGGEQEPLKASEMGSGFISSKKIADVDWNVVVKGTFIEVVIPPCKGSKRRSMSESALPRFEKQEKPWKSIVSDELQDMSDVSTNVSLEEDLDSNSGSTREDLCRSSDGEGEVEMPAQPALPYQFVETWWMPMGYGASPPSMCPATSTCFGQTMPLNLSSFVPMPWADHSMGVMDSHGVDADAEEWRTTVMIRNMPNNYTRDMLLELVDSMGFAGLYDFAYLPVDFQSQAGLGYAFINFATVADAQLCFDRFEGFSNWKVPSEKVCTVTWSSPTQGLEAHIERYKNSPVMHGSAGRVEASPLAAGHSRCIPSSKQANQNPQGSPTAFVQGCVV